MIFTLSSVDQKVPFFMYMAFQHNHHPQFAGKMFTNSSVRGPYGDSLAEMDGEWGRSYNSSRMQESMTILLFSFLLTMGEMRYFIVTCYVYLHA